MTEPVDWAGRTFGQLTRDEQRRVLVDVTKQLSRELNSPAARAVFSGEALPGTHCPSCDGHACPDVG